MRESCSGTGGFNMNVLFFTGSVRLMRLQNQVVGCGGKALHHHISSTVGGGQTNKGALRLPCRDMVVPTCGPLWGDPILCRRAEKHQLPQLIVKSSDE